MDDRKVEFEVELKSSEILLWWESRVISVRI